MWLALALVSLAQAPEARNAPSSQELLQKLDQAKDLSDREKTFEVAASLGRLYYSSGRFAESRVYLQQAVDKAAVAKEKYLSLMMKVGGKPLPSAAQAGCPQAVPVALDVELAVAQTKTDPLQAAACLRAGLQGLIVVEEQLGNARFLMRDAAGALEVFERSLAVFPESTQARYGRAAVTIDLKGDDLKALGQAKSDLELVLKAQPASANAATAKSLLARCEAGLAAGGLSKVAPTKARPESQPPQLTREMVEAVQNVEKTPEVEQGFAKLVDEAEEHLAKGRFQDALDNYKRVVPFQPENGRARAGMAWSLVRLNKQPMADNVWRVASADPGAIDALGDSLKAKGDAAGAKQLWQRLGDTVPAYASKLTAKLQ